MTRRFARELALADAVQRRSRSSGAGGSTCRRLRRSAQCRRRPRRSSRNWCSERWNRSPSERCRHRAAAGRLDARPARDGRPDRAAHERLRIGCTVPIRRAPSSSTRQSNWSRSFRPTIRAASSTACSPNAAAVRLEQRDARAAGAAGAGDCSRLGRVRFTRTHRARLSARHCSPRARWPASSIRTRAIFPTSIAWPTFNLRVPRASTRATANNWRRSTSRIESGCRSLSASR